MASDRDCPKGHDASLRYPKMDYRRGKMYMACGECRRIRRNKGRPPTYARWELVQDRLDFWSMFYTPDTAMRKAADDLGCSLDAIRLHIKRRDYQWS